MSGQVEIRKPVKNRESGLKFVQCLFVYLFGTQERLLDHLASFCHQVERRFCGRESNC